VQEAQVSGIRFDLKFDDRDDGTKVWAARCQDCDALLVGERYPQVTVVRVDESVPPAQFEQLKRMAAAAWDNARKTGHPVVVGDHRIVVDKTVDHGDLQRALEAHADACLRSKPQPGHTCVDGALKSWDRTACGDCRRLTKPEPASLPGPGEPR
jgi:hypothetical protein